MENNRIDTLLNIFSTNRIGIIFLIPGFNETLRVNGIAVVSFDAHEIEACRDDKRSPKVVIKVTPQSAYLHCAKAFLRSKLWKPEALVDREGLGRTWKNAMSQTFEAIDCIVRSQIQDKPNGKSYSGHS